jgi:hypothetical protein
MDWNSSSLQEAHASNNMKAFCGNYFIKSGKNEDKIKLLQGAIFCVKVRVRKGILSLSLSL